MKKRNQLLAILFPLVVGAFILGFILTEDIAFSENENRPLQERPKWTRERFVSGKFGEEMDAYLADQFPGREAFVGMKTQIQSMLGIRENNGIIEGKNNRLFQKYSVGDLNESCQGIRDFTKKYAVPTTLLMIPTKAAVYPEDLPKDAPMPDESRVAQEIFEKSECPTIFLLEDFLNHKGEKLYYDTDHHWTAQGAYLGYKALCREKGLAPLAMEDFYQQTVPEFYGALYSTGGYRYVEPDVFTLTHPFHEDQVQVDYQEEKETTALIDEDYLESKDKYAAYLGGNFAYVKITTPQPGKKVLVIKDSFANALIPYLTAHYSEIHLVDLRYLRHPIEEEMEKAQPDEVWLVYNVKNFVEDEHLRKLGL